MNMEGLIYLILLVFIGYPLSKIIGNISVNNSYIKGKAYKISWDIKNISEGLANDFCSQIEKPYFYRFIFCEMMFFFYCINIAKLKDDEDKQKIAKNLDKYLLDRIETQEKYFFEKNKKLISDAFIKRKEYYFSLFIVQNFNINDDFCNKLFDYQSKILCYIFKNETFFTDDSQACSENNLKQLQSIKEILFCYKDTIIKEYKKYL